MLKKYPASHIKWLDDHKQYRDMRKHSHSLDLLHKHKVSINPSLKELVAKTAIKRLYERKRRPLKKSDFLEWLGRWLQYWEFECEVPVKNNSAHWYNFLLRDRKLIYEEQDESAGEVFVYLVKEGSKEIVTAVAQFDAHRYGFEHMYDVPPAYYRR